MSWITIPRAKLVNAEPGPAQATSIQKTAYALQNPGGSTRTPYNTPADAPPIAVARGVTGAGRAISAARAKFTGGPVAAPNRPNSLEMISRRMATSLQIGGAPVAPEQGIVAPTFDRRLINPNLHSPQLPQSRPVPSPSVPVQQAKDRKESDKVDWPMSFSDAGTDSAGSENDRDLSSNSSWGPDFSPTRSSIRAMTSAKQPVYRVSYGGPAVAGTDSDHWLSDEFSGYEADKLRPSAPPLQNPVSLLTTLLHSSEYRSDQHLATTNPPSTHTSAPPTATSTPVPPAPDLRSLPTASILRRGSMSASSDTDYVGLGLGVAGFEGLAGRLGRLDEKRERSETSERAGTAHQRQTSCAPHRALKFAVAPTHPPIPIRDSASRRSSSPFARERAVQRDIELDSEEEDLEESDSSEDAILPGFRRTPWQHDGEYDSDSDLGYQEDEENGAFSDDEDYTTQIPQAPSPSDFPFARPTNYRRRQHNRPSPSASAAAFEVPAVRPPSRRGRGNIRVVDAVSSPTEDRKGCSRHCSPPPASSRSSSRILGPRSGHSDRLSDAGPRGGRAGSPMPAKIASDAENDSDDGDEIGDGDDQIRNSGRPRGGWRSDDSVFGRHLQTRGVNRLDPMARHVSAPPQVSPYDGVPRSVPMEYQLSSSGSNTRNECRRARAPTPRHEDSSIAPLSAPLLSQATCPPALEDTPAMARSISRTELGQASGYLGKTLASQPPNLLRTKSLGSKVTFGPDVDPRPERLSRLPIHAVSADEGAARRILQAVKSKPIACPRIAKRGEDFAW